MIAVTAKLWKFLIRDIMVQLTSLIWVADWGTTVKVWTGGCILCKGTPIWKLNKIIVIRWNKLAF